MTQTQELLAHLASIRQRLCQAQSFVFEARDEAAHLVQRHPAEHVVGGKRVQALLDGSMRQLVEVSGPVKTPELTRRVRGTAERCHDLVRQLRALSNDAVLEAEAAESPLTTVHRHCAALAEMAVHLLQNMPADAATQTRLCDGMDGLLDALADKIGGLQAVRDRQAVRTARVATLGHWLDGLHAGRRLALAPVTALAEAVAHDACQGEPLTIDDPGRVSPAANEAIFAAWRTRCVASQGLNAAQVAARVFPHCLELLIAALVADAGLLDVPANVLAQPTKLDAGQWRQIERHPHLGASWLHELTSVDENVVEAVRDHHERPDGTGYPSGRPAACGLAAQLSASATYAALSAPRPHREARDPQTALTETLLAAERGLLNRAAANAIGRLSFFPVGSVVELDDGAVGVVVATNDAQPAAKPVIALLTNADGHRVPGPQMSTHRAVVKALSADDRRRRLGATFPHLA